MCICVPIPIKQVIIFCLTLSQVSAFNYCELDCNGTQHTMCSYAAGGSDVCSNNDKVFLSVQQKRYILSFHNKMRDRVAKGNEDKGVNNHQPSAGNMMKLVWDGEIGMIAKRWADQCDQPTMHDTCRKSMDGTEVGQNVYIGMFKDTGAIGMEKVIERDNRITNALEKWYNEVEYMDERETKKFLPYLAESVGNFTQIVWADTIYIGCGYTEFKMANQDIMYKFVCDYKRTGNIPYEEIYRKGRPCSSCPPRSNCSETWSGLCWNGASNDFIDDSNGILLHQPHMIAIFFYITVIIYSLQ